MTLCSTYHLPWGTSDTGLAPSTHFTLQTKDRGRSGAQHGPRLSDGAWRLLQHRVRRVGP